MVIHDFDLVGITMFPAKTDPPLVVKTDAELTGAGSSEFLEPIPRGNREVVEFRRRIQLPELPERAPLDLCAELPDWFPAKQPLRILIAETADHGQ